MEKNLSWKTLYFDIPRHGNPKHGGLILYINKNIPCRSLKDVPSFHYLELMAIEINQKKTQKAFYRSLETKISK